jgi:hypothetical protein
MTEETTLPVVLDLIPCVAADRPRFWRGWGGALLCDRAVEGLTVELDEPGRRGYGGRWMVGESMLDSACRRIVAALGGEWCEEAPVIRDEPEDHAEDYRSAERGCS